jgi:6-phosphogluconolactonase (cycloisomerase 2 family)
MRVRTHEVVMAALAVAVIATGGLVFASSPPAGGSPPTDSRLVSVQHLPLPAPDMCAWPTDDDAGFSTQVDEAEDALAAFRQGRPGAFLMASLGAPNLLTSLHQGNLYAALQQVTSASTAPRAAERTLTALRIVRDTHPTYSAVAVDVNSNEIILQDNNLWSYRVFNRTDNTPAGAEFTPPKRLVQGDKTALQFNNGLYVDPKNGDIYSVESDTGDKMVVFSREADGNVPPKRILNTPHRVYNVAVDEARSELFVTVEYPPEVVVYRKDAGGDDQPLRRIQGDNTGLDAPHGIAVDEKNRLLYVTTWGHHSNFRIPGTGRFYPPAIKVYSLDARGDSPPLRVITGDRTQLNWPAAIKLNPETGDLYVANDINQSVLVFRNAATAQGNVTPARVLKGDRTRLRNPTGVALDLKNQEVWVSNLGNASATAYPLMADGNVAPLRVVRSAPDGKRSLNFGRTAAVAYDSRREQLLVPN